jgi:hypothetical protein
MTRCPTCGVDRTPSSGELWAGFVSAWWEHYGSGPVSAQELHTLPQGRAIHPSLNVFGRELSAACSGEAVAGRRVVRRQWPGTKRNAGRIVYRPATWALEEVAS